MATATGNREQDKPIFSMVDVSKAYVVNQRGSGKASLRAVDRVDMHVMPGETLAIVGESGCGKSTIARLGTGLETVTDGAIFYRGDALADLRGAAKREFRRDVQMVFQDPYSSLNPRMTVFDTVSEAWRIHGTMPAREMRDAASALLETVELGPEFLDRRPARMSGGQRQRVAIARAMALQPKLVFCDEALSALDVSTQAGVLKLLADIQARTGIAYVFISHDLDVVASFADRVAVMYLGRVVETGPTRDVLAQPRHPYTRALVSARVTIDFDEASKPIVLSGDVPSPIDPPTGCHFHTRCWTAIDSCTVVEPPLEPLDNGRLVACHLPEPAHPASGMTITKE